MVMSAKTEFWIAVIGLSGRDNGDSFQGPGKSCLCDRFMYPDRSPSTGHTSIISQQDFHGPIINTDHFLYWGRTRRTVDGKVVEFNVIEQTEFLDDVTFSPFNARDPYIKRSTSTSINSSRKIQYLSPEQLQDPKSQKALKFASRKLHIDGFLCVYDVSKVNDRQAGTQYKFVFELLDLIDVPVVLVATKCDKGRSRHFEEMMYLAKVQKVPIVETSSLENVNVSQAFFSLVRIFNRQVIVSKKHIQYFTPKELTSSSKKKKKKEKKKKQQRLEKIRSSPPPPLPPPHRNGGVVSRNESSETDWPVTDPALKQDQVPTPCDSPLTDSLLSEPPYEHINGEEEEEEEELGGRGVLYENYHEKNSESQESGTSSTRPRHLQNDNVSRDSQLSKSDSMQSKTSSEEYIPVPRAPYDPIENYENLRYHHLPGLSDMSNSCPSPTSHSSDSERGGFLSGVPEHMKSLLGQRPWETQYYTNITITPRQSDQTTSSVETRSSSSIDTDCQANLNYGRQLPPNKPSSSGSSYHSTNGQQSDMQHGDGQIVMEEEEEYANIPRLQVSRIMPEEESDDVTSGDVIVPEDLPPYPDTQNTQPDEDQMLGLQKDLEEMNTLVGEISSLVWQNEPLPPPPSDLLHGSEHHLSAGHGEADQKTPTNELAISPNPYANVVLADQDCYENVQPRLPPRQPALPPRNEPKQTEAPPLRNVPQRIPLLDRRVVIPPAAPSLPPRSSDPAGVHPAGVHPAGVHPAGVHPAGVHPAGVHPAGVHPAGVHPAGVHPAGVQPRTDITVPPRTIALPARAAGERTESCDLPPRVPLRGGTAAAPPHRIPVPRALAERQNNMAPHLPPRTKPDSTNHAGITTQSALQQTNENHNNIPVRVPLPPRPPSLPHRATGPPSATPVYSEVEKRPAPNIPRIHQHDFSPYVIPSVPRIDRWEEYTNCIEKKKPQNSKKKVKVKIPQR